MQISGNIYDIINGVIFPGTLTIEKGKIVSIRKDNCSYKTLIIPGFIDSHVHIESSLLTPAEFAKIAVKHGTVATISDPHEIANVLGIDGVNFMIKNGKTVPFKFYFGAPSCVPATEFETSGAKIDSNLIEILLKRPDIKYLSEVMNYPAVINKDPEMMLKIHIAKKYKKVIDGHAPRIRGKELQKYIEAGISTDHEINDEEEALEKLTLGMKILLREGSATKNFDTLINLIDDHYNNIMFCTDDIHPDELITGHINHLVKRAINWGYDPLKVLRCASLNPVKHYALDVGLLQVGDNADFLVVDSLTNLTILKTFINGKLVMENGESLINCFTEKKPNFFNINEKSPFEFSVKGQNKKIKVIEAVDGSLITKKSFDEPKLKDGCLVSDENRDILKITVVNRYFDKKPAVAFVKNFGLKKGAIASSISHDSHNIIAVGVSDEDIAKAVNIIIKNKGGIAVVSEDVELLLALPIAGLMTDKDAYSVASKYIKIKDTIKMLGCKLNSPLMTLSFMALLVIPCLKLSDKGLFDSESFQYTDLFLDSTKS
ncbi:MAG: adenine deaminase [Thermodesulfovibrionales bacterium]|nr:adenine deaminase [Thermodesulfovibrionales bacterium]